MIQVNPKQRPNCDELMDHPIFKKRSNKYFPEFEDSEYETSYAGHSTLLKTIRIPKNIMHLSSRLPKKNYDNSLASGNLSSERPNGFKNVYHNTMGKKKSSLERIDRANMISLTN